MDQLKRLAALMVLTCVAACTARVDPDAAAIYEAALARHGHVVAPDATARALLFDGTVTSGLEHLVLRHGLSLDDDIDVLHAAIAPRLASSSLEADHLLTAFLEASRVEHDVPALTLSDVALIRIDEDDYRGQLTDADCKAIYTELGFDDGHNLGLWAVSNIGFNVTRDEALLYTSTGRRGEILLMRKVDDGWQVEKTMQLWVNE